MNPIGNLATRFTGQYDGQGNAVTHFSFNNSSADDVGIFGVTSSSSVISNLSITCANITAHNTVGIAAGQSYGSIVNVTVSGIVLGNFNVGGLVGVSGGSIERSFSQGTVQGNQTVGGLSGSALVGSLVVNSYSNASVEAFSVAAGGLVGVLDGATVQDSHSTGTVVAPSFAGGLIGLSGGASVLDSYWDTQTSGQATSFGGTGKTTAEMQMQTTFDPPWDFVNVWTIDESNDYPRLIHPPLCICGDLDRSGGR